MLPTLKRLPTLSGSKLVTIQFKTRIQQTMRCSGSISFRIWLSNGQVGVRSRKKIMSILNLRGAGGLSQQVKLSLLIHIA
ncbi:MAG: hypothetical protein CM1200mP40_22420 [Gammaproteobacteria bacterium]|nr:MAG: hypothetical protein CM1200mP40_22420 [Gammaproteobacteria bacterium]